MFEGNKLNRVTFLQFFQFLEVHSIHEQTPEQFQGDLNIFDEDHNGQAVIEDVVRVLKNYAQLSDADVANFVKICLHGSKMTEE